MEPLFILVRILVFVVGLAIVAYIMTSAIRTFVLPRSAPDMLTRTFFLNMRRLFNLRMRWTSTFLERDGIMAMYAPVCLIMLPAVWLTGVLLGYMCLFWAVGVQPWSFAFKVSGSSLLTLGFATLDDVPTTIMILSEATIGLILVALLIAYLPTMYAAFSKREAAVTMLEVRAGSPPSAIEMILRFNRLHRLAQLDEMWVTWETWFVELEETHTSLAALAFFRSPKPHRSWVTAAGAVLDGASLVSSTIDVPPNAQIDLCIRAGYLALRYISDFFRIPYNPAPNATDPISISRAEYDAAC
ncbi:MAG TPA: hypothetical protein VKR42_10060, partial [Ktedonobacteraceae bacterium]|nr:hypothetical protein [Ktedonobacteraceae bacterium]